MSEDNNISGFFGVNTAQSIVDSPSEDKRVVEIRGLNKLTEQMRESNAKMGVESGVVGTGNIDLKRALSEIDLTTQSAENETGKSFSNLGSFAIEQLKDLADRSIEGDSDDQKMIAVELKEMTKFIKQSIDDPKEQKMLNDLSGQIGSGIEKNTQTVRKFSTGVLDVLSDQVVPVMVGAIAGVFADSPIFGIAAGLITEYGRRKVVARKEKLNEKREKIKEKYQRNSLKVQQLSEEHNRKLLDLQKDIHDNLQEASETEQESTGLETQSNEALDVDNLADSVGQSIANQIDMDMDEFASGIAEGLRAKFEEIGIDLDAVQSHPNPFDNNTPDFNNQFDLDESLFEQGDSDGVIVRLDKIHDILHTTYALSKRGREEQRREGEFQRQELINAIEGLGSKSKSGDEEEGGLMEMLDGIGLGAIGAVMGGIGAWVAKFAFGLKSIAKIAKRLFMPVTAIISAFSGVYDGFKAFEKSGSVLSGITTGIMSAGDTIIKSFTFGLLDLETITGGLQKLIPQSISDGVFGAFDWVASLFSDPVGAIKQAGSSLISGITDMFLMPFKAIADLFGIDYKKTFSKITDFMGKMSDTVYEWIAGIIPNFIPDALVPDSILKYRNKQVNAEVAREYYEEALQDAYADGNSPTNDKVMELAKMKEDALRAEVAALNETIGKKDIFDPKDEDYISLQSKKKQLAYIENKSSGSEIKTMTNNTPTIDTPTIKPVLNDKPKSSLMINNLDNTPTNDISIIKNDKIHLGQKLNEKRAMQSAPVQSTNANAAIVNNVQNVSNNSKTHIGKDVFNSDPSIMKPAII